MKKGIERNLHRRNYDYEVYIDEYGLEYITDFNTKEELAYGVEVKIYSKNVYSCRQEKYKDITLFKDNKAIATGKTVSWLKNEDYTYEDSEGIHHLMRAGEEIAKGKEKPAVKSWTLLDVPPTILKHPEDRDFDINSGEDKELLDQLMVDIEYKAGTIKGYRENGRNEYLAKISGESIIITLQWDGTWCVRTQGSSRDNKECSWQFGRKSGFSDVPYCKAAENIRKKEREEDGE